MDGGAQKSLLEAATHATLYIHSLKSECLDWIACGCSLLNGKRCVNSSSVEVDLVFKVWFSATFDRVFICMHAFLVYSFSFPWSDGVLRHWSRVIGVSFQWNIGKLFIVPYFPFSMNSSSDRSPRSGTSGWKYRYFVLTSITFSPMQLRSRRMLKRTKTKRHLAPNSGKNEAFWWFLWRLLHNSRYLTRISSNWFGKATGHLVHSGI